MLYRVYVCVGRRSTPKTNHTAYASVMHLPLVHVPPELVFAGGFVGVLADDGKLVHGLRVNVAGEEVPQVHGVDQALLGLLAAGWWPLAAATRLSDHRSLLR